MYLLSKSGQLKSSRQERFFHVFLLCFTCSLSTQPNRIRFLGLSLPQSMLETFKLGILLHEISARPFWMRLMGKKLRVNDGCRRACSAQSCVTESARHCADDTKDQYRPRLERIISDPFRFCQLIMRPVNASFLHQTNNNRISPNIATSNVCFDSTRSGLPSSSQSVFPLPLTTARRVWLIEPSKTGTTLDLKKIL